ncbi:MAG: gliding motility-associated C-terminal domain-containing protein, partial [Bacteroidota bacterium]
VDLGEDQTIEWGEEVDIIPFLSVDSTELSQLTWQTAARLDCPDCLYQTELLLGESTRFFLEVVDLNGCVAEDDVTIYVEKTRDIYVPNAFSPTGEGNNDMFYIFSKKETIQEIKEMRIFDRWGNNVFEKYDFQPNDPREGWDGKYRNKVLNPGVFVWYAVIELVNGEDITLMGDVTLIK